MFLFNRFLKSELNTDPNYWDDLAKNELINDAHSKGARLRYENIYNK